MVVLAEETHLLFGTVVQELHDNGLHGADDHVAADDASAVLATPLHRLEEREHAFGVIHEHVLVSEAVGIYYEDEAVDANRHFSDEII